MFPSGPFFIPATTPPATAPTVTGARNGVSMNGTFVELGNAIGAAGNPGQLLHDTEIWFNGRRLFFGRNNGIDNVIAFDQDDGISIFNNTGNFIQLLFSGINFNMFMPDADTVFFDYNAAAFFQYQFSTDLFTFSSPVIVPGLGAGIRIDATAAVVFGPNDFTILCDSTAGNQVVTINPAILVGRVGNVKKISTDANTITLTASSGFIMGIPPGAATLVMADPGENVQFQSDGTNIYVI